MRLRSFRKKLKSSYPVCSLWISHKTYTVESLLFIGGLMFVDFVGNPYPQIYVSLNLYLIVQILKICFLKFKIVFIYDGYALNTIISFGPSCENRNNLFWAPYLFKPTSITNYYFLLRSLFLQSYALESPLDGFIFPQ